MKIHKKIIKIVILEKGTFFCYNFQSIVNLQLKFWGCDENKYGLSFDNHKNNFKFFRSDQHQECHCNPNPFQSYAV